MSPLRHDNMAEDTSYENVKRIFQLVSKQHDSPALFLLESVVDEWRKNRASYDGPGHLMRKCLHQAAVSNQGQEALQIHMVLFRHLFVRNELAAPELVLELGFSVNDYFELLRDEQLGWMSFLTKIIPYLRLQESNCVLANLTQFLRSSGESPQTVADARLLVFAMSLVHSIVLDFLVAESIATDGGVADVALALPSSDKPKGELTSNAQILAAHLATSLESLLKICRSDQLLAATLHDTNLFKQLVESLTLTAVVLNPYLTTEDKKTILLDFYRGQVISMNQIASRKKEKNDKSSSLHDKFHWTGVSLQRCTGQLETNEHETTEKDSSSCVRTSFCGFNILINEFPSQPQLTAYFDLVCFFGQKCVDKDKYFCKHLGDVFLSDQDLYVGRHIVSCQVYSWFLEHQQNVVKGKLLLNKVIRNVSELQTVTECLLPFEMCDFSFLTKTEIDHILESKKVLCGKADLDLVTEAVALKKNGWRGLLELGLGNTDINGWWRSGFFQLVWDNDEALSSERNVKQILKILAQVAVKCQKSADADFRVAMYRLFNIMFKRLPVLLQEQVVLSTLAPPGSDGEDFDISGLHHLLSKEEVNQQLTPLLNKLTSAGADKMMGHILFLCLFGVDVVIQQAVSVAMLNKAQVLPVIEVLRQMARICHTPEPKTGQPRLLFCLHEILSGAEIDNNKADNIVRMFCLLTKTYTLNINIDKQIHISNEMPQLLSQSAIFEQFICPALNKEMSQKTNAVSSQDVQKESSVSPNNQTWDVGCGMEQVSSGNTEVEGSVECRDGEKMAECRHQAISVKVDSLVSSELPLDVALTVLSALLEKVDALHLQALKVFPLLIVLADIYAKNFIVLQDGRLDKNMLLVKQVCLKNIVLATSAVLTHSKVFTKADFLWLKQRALSCWLCVAVLKPVLNIGCDVELHDILCSFTRQLVLQGSGRCSIRALVMLLQLALVNDEMLSDMMSVVKQCQLSAGHSQLILAVRQVLAVSLPNEMYRLVKIILVFLANQEQPFPDDSGLLVPDSPAHSHVQLCVLTSQLLTDAVLQLSLMELPAESSCHVVFNYQAAVQALLQNEAHLFCFLVDLFCHCCLVLSVVTGQAAQVLQASAMNLLTKMKTFFSSLKSETVDLTKAQEIRLEHERGVASMGAYIECVSEESVRQNLLTQLMNVL
ncbi:hypothetical protein BsWGS_23644 [Bradybaena similaris]